MALVQRLKRFLPARAPSPDELEATAKALLPPAVRDLLQLSGVETKDWFSPETIKDFKLNRVKTVDFRLSDILDDPLLNIDFLRRENAFEDAQKSKVQTWVESPQRAMVAKSKSIVPEVTTGYGDINILQRPPYDPITLAIVADRHWVVRMCIQKLVRESTRKGFKFEPKFEAKCGDCGRDYQFVPINGRCPTKSCESHGKDRTRASTVAGSKASTLANPRTLPSESAPEPTYPGAANSSLILPDVKQLENVTKWLNNVNPNLSAIDVIERYTHDLLTFDDAYVSLTKATGGYQIWPEDARFMAMAFDTLGRVGSPFGPFFCPKCEDERKKNPATVQGDVKIYYDMYKEGDPCPVCGGKLSSIAYGQRFADRVVTAWKKDEIFHGRLFGTGSKAYGTPIMWAVQTQLSAMALIDMYQKDSFDKMKTPRNIFIVHGTDENTLARMLQQHEEIKRQNPMADMWIPIPQALGPRDTKVGIEKIESMAEPLLKGSLPQQMHYMEAICMTFGVSPSSIGVQTPGRLGSAQSGGGVGGGSGGAQGGGRGGGTEQNDVTPETVAHIQGRVSRDWDRFLKKLFPEIKDWNFQLISAHENEDARDWATIKIQMDAAAEAVTSGFDVVIDEDGTPRISGTGKQPTPAPSPFGGDKKPGEDKPNAGADASKKPPAPTKKALPPRYIMAPAPNVLAHEVPDADLYAMMNPMNFLNLLGYDSVQQFKNDSKYFEQASYDNLAQRMRDNQEIDPLSFKVTVNGDDVKVSKHNGRHRAAAASDLGIGQVPVVIHVVDGGDRPLLTSKLSVAARTKIDAMMNKSKSFMKASRHDTLLSEAETLYRSKLEDLSKLIFNRINEDIKAVLIDRIFKDDWHVDIELRDTLMTRFKRILDHSLRDGETMAKEMAIRLFSMGVHDASNELGRIAKQDTPDQAAIDAANNRTIDAMRNTLYFGDKQSYLQTIQDTINEGIEENWTTDQLAKALQEQLDPNQEHFSSYMWDRIARTETATYVIDGRLSAYKGFDIPMVRRIVASDATDALCAPYADAIYNLDDAEGVIPSHPFCRCSFAPYYGDEEPIDALDIPLS